MPSKPVQYLSLDEVIVIHERLIERFGGEAGIRDKGLLQSALLRPQTGYYDTLEEMAAALFESFITNYAFLDGNKRVAFFVSDVFLRLNGWKLKVTGDAGYSLVVGSIEKGECSYEQLLPWIRDHLEKI